MNVYHTPPIYVSERSAKNFWQDYRVFPDRVELRCWIILSAFIIPAQDMLDVVVQKPHLFGGKNWYALKLDWADLCEHVALHRKSGLFKQLRFTPDYPENFAAACRSIMTSNA